MCIFQATSSAGETGEAEGSTSESQNSSPHNSPNKTNNGAYNNFFVATDLLYYMYCYFLLSFLSSNFKLFLSTLLNIGLYRSPLNFIVTIKFYCHQ